MKIAGHAQSGIGSLVMSSSEHLLYFSSNLPVPSQRPVANDSKLSTEDAVVGQVSRKQENRRGKESTTLHRNLLGIARSSLTA
jgi:hypothetical protein